MDIRNLFIRLGVKVDKAQMTQAKKSIHEFKRGMSILAKGAAVAFGAISVGFGNALKQAGKMEQYGIAFETMLGSAEKANKLMADLKDLTLRTPFKLEDTVKGAQRLLAMGSTAEGVTKDMEMLGDMAAGLGVEKLPQLILAFGQIRTAGRLMGGEMKQLREAGVNVLPYLAKLTGKSEQEISRNVGKMNISFETVQKAMQDLRADKFMGLMEKQSKSLLGMWSVFLDYIQMFSADIGKVFLPQVKEVFKSLMEWIKLNREIIKTKITEYVQKFVWFLEAAWGGAKRLYKILDAVVNLFGGWKTVMLTLSALMAAFFVMQIVSLTLALMPILKIVAAVGMIKALWEDVYYTFAGGKNTFFNKLIELYPWVGKLKQALGGIGKIIAGIFALFTDFDSGAWKDLLLDGVKDLGLAFFDIYGKVFRGLVNLFKKLVVESFSFLKNGALGILGWVGGKVKGGVDALLESDFRQDVRSSLGLSDDRISRSGMSRPAMAGGGNNISINMPMSFERVPAGISEERLMNHLGGVVEKKIDQKFGNAYMSVQQEEEQ